MLKKKSKEDIKFYLLLTPFLIIGLYIVFVIVSTIFSFPFGKILDDNPREYIACKLNPLVVPRTGGSYNCHLEYYDSKLAEEWSGYKGCNESTQGYSVGEDGKGQIEGLTSCDSIRLT